MKLACRHGVDGPGGILMHANYTLWLNGNSLVIDNVSVLHE
jgi:hypothetical protein